MKNRMTLKDSKIDIKLKLSALWTAIMLLYIYNDFFSLFKPGVLNGMLDGKMGPFEATQLALFAAAVLMAIPATMIFLSLALKATINKWVNVILGILYIVVMVASLPGEWNFYIFMGIVELILTATVVILSLKWPTDSI